MNPAPNDTRDLLPDFLRRPLWLIGTLVVPQVLLMLLNLRSWWLVAGEMTANQSGDALALGVAGLALWVAGLGAALWMSRAGARLDWRHGVALVVAHAAYLWAFTSQFDDIIPRSVPDWMLPRGTVMYHQYALIMPALLHGGLLVACFRARRSAGVETASTLGMLVGIPLVGYVFIHLADELWRGLSHPVSTTVVFVFFTSMTTLLVITLLRALLLLGGLIRRGGGRGRMVLIALVGIVGPVAGLLLNEKIPFPADFQSAAVYALAVLNGFALLLPVDGPRGGQRLAWILQAMLFPFTAYFMIVFLPFLPLLLLAIVVAGSGLLMLVPLVLFVVHVQQLAAGWRAAARGGRIAAALALCVLPGLFAGRAHFDRMTLKVALDHVYSPDYRDGRLRANRGALKRGLENLRDFKAGLQLPLLGDYYNHVVFGDLVLPDEKLKSLYLTFFGRELPPADANRFGANLFGATRRNVWGGWRGTPPATNDVRLVSLDTTRAAEGDCETAVAKLELHNDSTGQREYVTQLHLPPGVFVSGYWLHIKGERVPGRIFEKKAALWVYEMIRDMTRRDPGLLLYKDPTTVQLRVFPMEANETRTTEIELIWPRGLAPPIRIADRAIDTLSDAGAAPYVVASSDRGRLLVASPARLRQAAAADPEPPYVHVVLDASEGAQPAELAARARAAAAQVPGARDVVVSTANYEFETLTPAPVPLDRLEEVVRAVRVPARGGFCRDRALKCVLTWRAEHQPARGVVPLLVLAERPRAVLPDEDTAYFALWHPSVRGYLECASGPTASAFDFRRQPVEGVVGQACLLKLDDACARVPLAGDEPVVSLLPGGTGGGLEITNARYRAAATAWMQYADWLRNPAGRDGERAGIVAASRAANALTPLTSFIVVENSAQWRLLEEKEKNKLKHEDALEIQKAPEPSKWLLLAGLAAWYAWRRRSELDRLRVVPDNAGREEHLL